MIQNSVCYYYICSSTVKKPFHKRTVAVLNPPSQNPIQYMSRKKLSYNIFEALAKPTRKSPYIFKLFFTLFCIYILHYEVNVSVYPHSHTHTHTFMWALHGRFVLRAHVSSLTFEKPRGREQRRKKTLNIQFQIVHMQSYEHCRLWTVYKSHKWRKQQQQQQLEIKKQRMYKKVVIIMKYSTKINE